MKLNIDISICNDTTQYATSNWEIRHIDSLRALAVVVKTNRYSNAIFKDNYRKGENVKGFHKLLIFDIDNEENMPYLSIQDAKKLLENKNIQPLIIPSKNHQKIKGDKKAVDRFRIIIPTQTPLNLLYSKTFREFQALISKQLGPNSFVDTKALSDRARYYDMSPISVPPYIIDKGDIIDIREFEKKAILNIQEKEETKLQELEKIKAIKQNPNVFKNMPLLDQTQSLSYLSENGFNAILNTPITALIRHYETIKSEYNDGYDMIKTEKAKYAIIKDSNLVHDFKSGETYNPYTYVSKIISSNNANKIAREFENLSGEKVLETKYISYTRAAKYRIKTC
ncbi:hypothetical protein [Helicobacter bilis]|uniref:hypothetical protein n=1 Tax=Helicobacter bilis TaxID=37372 RepID=UPI0026EBBD19|nr:hypothetical protein [Helicobacter bilis]MCI7410240.1 hypothetical protein [Helicobacter bilis]MDD7297225.1 hypothetical protein [Helicobacter bilis]MDY4399557.1 hypothetical protein [Helicobacter bilis]